MARGLEGLLSGEAEAGTWDATGTPRRLEGVQRRHIQPGLELRRAGAATTATHPEALLLVEARARSPEGRNVHQGEWEVGLTESQRAHQLRSCVVDPISESGGVYREVDLRVLDDLPGDVFVIPVESGGGLENGHLLHEVLESQDLGALAGGHVAPDLDGAPEVAGTQVAHESRSYVELLLL
ncbi:hypothetical protein HWI79_1914 [Cryptosporidium felis]|nr:hypothetical protein HWI79_1914 [Cryptosporidium felis]